MPHCARALPTSRRRAVLAAALAAPQWLSARSLPLGDRLPQILAGCGLPAASLGLYVGPVDRARDTATSLPDNPFVLASTAKIVTSLAALDLLGSRWRWRTHAFATGPLRAGRLHGDLLIVGGGDPRLSGSELRQWMSTLHAKGLVEVQGDLVVDRTAFLLHESDHAGTPPPSPERPHHARPDALVIDAGAKRLSPLAHVAEAWRDVGGRVLGRVREGDLARGSADSVRLPLFDAEGEPVMPMATHLSPPLPEVLHEINKTSHNLAARHLMLSLARGFPTRPATLAKARERVQQWLARQGLARGDIELDNGSGLSRAERGRPRAMAHLLRQAWAGEESRSFVDSLPVAGVDGTLAHRLQHGAATGQAYLKTGTLLDTRSLAGYVRGRSGQVHVAAIYVHHPEAARAVSAIDAVIETLARQG